MRNKKIALYTLMALPVTATLAAMFCLPDKIPAHYGIDGKVDRWGSKYEALIIPIIIVAFGIVMLTAAKISSKNERSGKNNEGLTLITGICCLALFDIMDLYFLFAGFVSITDLSDIPIDIESLTVIALGIVFIIIGNYAPKAKLNSLIGFRTPRTMKNETTWKKCNRFFGITFMATGVIQIVGAALIFRGFGSIFFMLVLIVAEVIVNMIYSYKI